MVYPMVYPMVFRRSAWIPQGATSAAWVAWLPRFNPRVERLCHDGPGGRSVSSGDGTDGMADLLQAKACELLAYTRCYCSLFILCFALSSFLRFIGLRLHHLSSLPDMLF